MPFGAFIGFIMALDNYANLKASVASWSHREDVGGLIDDFILLAETEFYTGNEAQIRTRDMIVTETSTTVADSRFQALPTNYLEMRSFKIDTAGRLRSLYYKTPEQLPIFDTSGDPCYYTITSQIEYDAPAADTYATSIMHYAKLTALSASNTTNAILTKYPTVYLYGCLWALNQWAVDAEEEAKYYTKFIKAIAGANSSDNDGLLGIGAQKTVRGRNP